MRPAAAIMTAGAALSGFLLNCSAAEEKISVTQSGGLTHVRSFFSEREDVLVTMNKGLNGQVNFHNARLVPSDATMADAASKKGVVFHWNGDDTPPWNLNNTFIGANHGCSDMREVTAKGHGLSTADLGSEWLDAAGTKFYVLKIVDADKFWVLSENKGGDDVWRFVTIVKGPELRASSGGRTVAFSEAKMEQLRPACRIRSQKWLVDGVRELGEGEEAVCDFVEAREEYDIINPAAVLKAVVKNAGRETSFVAADLPSFLTFKTTYRFLPRGACVVDQTCVASQKFDLNFALFVMTMALTPTPELNHRRYYIPKTLPFERDGRRHDFRAVEDFMEKLPNQLFFSEKDGNIEDPKNPPERFIQLLGNKTDGTFTPKVGLAIGYSLLEGITTPEERVRHTDIYHWIYTSFKSYPRALSQKWRRQVEPGEEFRVLAYRQYFDPQADKNATCVYWHKQGGVHVLHAHYHMPVEKDVIRLPESLVGKKVFVVEKTASVRLLTSETVPPEGVAVSVDGDYGHVVLKLE